jgi:hypothetical protein
MSNDTAATTFVFDVIAGAPAADVETATTLPPPEATLTGATVGGAADDVWLEPTDPNDVPEIGIGESSLGTASVTLAGSDAAAGHVVLGEGAGAVTVDFVDVPPDAG